MKSLKPKDKIILGQALTFVMTSLVGGITQIWCGEGGGGIPLEPKTPTHFKGYFGRKGYPF